MGEQGASQLSLRMLENPAPFTENSRVTSASMDPNHAAYAAAVDHTGILRYLFLGEGGHALPVAAFELQFLQATDNEGNGRSWQAVRRPWAAFSFLPRCTNREFLLCRSSSNKLLYTRLPASAAQPEQVYHFGSHIGSITALHVQPSGERVLSGCEEGVIKLWSLTTGVQLADNESAHRGAVTALQSIGESRFVSSGRDGTVLIWDTSSARTLNVLHSLSVACASPVSSLEVHDGPRRLESADAVVMPWRRMPNSDPCDGCEHKIPATLLAAGTSNGGVYVWSCVDDPWVHGRGTAMCQVCVDHTARGSPVASLSFSADGAVLAVGSSAPRRAPQQMLPDFREPSEGLVRVYNTKNWRCGEVLKLQQGAPIHLKFVPGEKAMANASGLPRIVFVAPPAGPALLLPSWLDCNSNDRGGDGGLHEHDPARLASLLHIEPELQRGSREAEEGAEERPRTWPPPGPVSLGARPQGPAAHGSVSHNGALTYAAGKPQHQPPQAMCSSGSAEGNESPRSSGPPPPAPQPCPRIPSPPVARASRGNVAVSASTAPRPSVAVSVAGAAAQGPAEAPVGGQSLAAKQLTEGKLGRHPTAMTPAKSTPAARAVKVVRHQPSGNAAKESIEITQPNKETPEAATRSKPQQVQDRSPLAAKGSTELDGSTTSHKSAAQAPKKAPARKPDVSGCADKNSSFASDTASSSARKQPVPPPKKEITTTEPAINELAPSCLIKPNLNATRRVMNEISRLEKENFDESQLLPAAAAAAAEEAARKSSAASGFSNLTAVDDRVELTVPRAVPKQLDPRWVASRDDKPKVETLWQVEDRLPGVSTSDGVAMESH